MGGRVFQTRGFAPIACPIDVIDTIGIDRRASSSSGVRPSSLEVVQTDFLHEGL